MSYKLLKKLGVVTKDLYTEALDAKTQATANTAGETVSFPLPLDQLLYGISLQCMTDVDGTLTALANNISEIELKLDGSKVVRNLTGAMIRALDTYDGTKPSTGFYDLKIADPELGADPLPLNQFTSATLKVTVAAGGTSTKNQITPVLRLGARQSYPKLGDLGLGKILVETMLEQKAYGTNTGEQVYDHMKANDVLGYLYELADDGTLSDTAFDYLTLELRNKTGKLTPFSKVPFTHIKEDNTREGNGNAIGTGLFYLPFPDTIRTSDYTTIRSLLNIASAGTNCQARVLERYMLGGV